MNNIMERIAADTAKIQALRAGKDGAVRELTALAEALSGLAAVWKLLPAALRERLAPYIGGGGA